MNETLHETYHNQMLVRLAELLPHSEVTQKYTGDIQKAKVAVLKEEVESKRIHTCGEKTIRRQLGSGRWIKTRFYCGNIHCEKCRLKVRDIIKEKLTKLILNDVDSCLIMLIVSEHEANKIIRRLRKRNIAWKRLPRYDYVVLLTLGEAIPFISDFDYEEKLAIEISNMFLDSLLNGKQKGKKDTGYLFPAFDDMAYGTTYELSNCGPVLNREDKETFDLRLGHIVTEEELVIEPASGVAYDVDSLQKCLNEAYQKTLSSTLQKYGQAHCGVLKRIYIKRYALADLPYLCQTFNKRNQALLKT